MKIIQAEKVLNMNNIDPLIYSIGRQMRIQCYTIEKENGVWITYNWERGLRHSIKIYKNEDDAVSDFLKNVIEIASLNERRNIVLR